MGDHQWLLRIWGCLLQAPPVSPEEAHREACEAGWEQPPEVRKTPLCCT